MAAALDVRGTALPVEENENRAKELIQPLDTSYASLILPVQDANDPISVNDYIQLKIPDNGWCLYLSILVSKRIQENEFKERGESIALTYLTEIRDSPTNTIWFRASQILAGYVAQSVDPNDLQGRRTDPPAAINRRVADAKAAAISGNDSVINALVPGDRDLVRTALLLRREGMIPDENAYIEKTIREQTSSTTDPTTYLQNLYTLRDTADLSKGPTEWPDLRDFREILQGLLNVRIAAYARDGDTLIPVERDNPTATGAGARLRGPAPTPRESPILVELLYNGTNHFSLLLQKESIRRAFFPGGAIITSSGYETERDAYIEELNEFLIPFEPVAGAAGPLAGTAGAAGPLAGAAAAAAAAATPLSPDGKAAMDRYLARTRAASPTAPAMKLKDRLRAMRRPSLSNLKRGFKKLRFKSSAAVTIAGENVILDEDRMDPRRHNHYDFIGLTSKYSYLPRPVAYPDAYTSTESPEHYLAKLTYMKQVFLTVFRESPYFDPKDPMPPCDELQYQTLVEGLENRIEGISDEILLLRDMKGELLSTDITRRIDTLNMLQIMTKNLIRRYGSGQCVDYGDVDKADSLNPDQMEKEDEDLLKIIRQVTLLMLQRRGPVNTDEGARLKTQAGLVNALRDGTPLKSENGRPMSMMDLRTLTKQMSNALTQEEANQFVDDWITQYQGEKTIPGVIVGLLDWMGNPTGIVNKHVDMVLVALYQQLKLKAIAKFDRELALDFTRIGTVDKVQGSTLDARITAWEGLPDTKAIKKSKEKLETLHTFLLNTVGAMAGVLKSEMERLTGDLATKTADLDQERLTSAGLRTSLDTETGRAEAAERELTDVRASLVALETEIRSSLLAPGSTESITVDRIRQIKADLDAETDRIAKQHEAALKAEVDRAADAAAAARRELEAARRETEEARAAAQARERELEAAHQAALQARTEEERTAAARRIEEAAAAHTRELTRVREATSRQVREAREASAAAQEASAAAARQLEVQQRDAEVAQRRLQEASAEERAAAQRAFDEEKAALEQAARDAAESEAAAKAAFEQEKGALEGAKRAAEKRAAEQQRQAAAATAAVAAAQRALQESQTQGAAAQQEAQQRLAAAEANLRRQREEAQRASREAQAEKAELTARLAEQIERENSRVASLRGERNVLAQRLGNTRAELRATQAAAAAAAAEAARKLTEAQGTASRAEATLQAAQQAFNTASAGEREAAERRLEAAERTHAAALLAAEQAAAQATARAEATARDAIARAQQEKGEAEAAAAAAEATLSRTTATLAERDEANRVLQAQKGEAEAAAAAAREALTAAQRANEQQAAELASQVRARQTALDAAIRERDEARRIQGGESTAARQRVEAAQAELAAARRKADEDKRASETEMARLRSLLERGAAAGAGAGAVAAGKGGLTAAQTAELRRLAANAAQYQQAAAKEKAEAAAALAEAQRKEGAATAALEEARRLRTEAEAAEGRVSAAAAEDMDRRAAAAEARAEAAIAAANGAKEAAIVALREDYEARIAALTAANEAALTRAAAAEARNAALEAEIAELRRKLEECEKWKRERPAGSGLSASRLGFNPFEITATAAGTAAGTPTPIRAPFTLPRGRTGSSPLATLAQRVNSGEGATGELPAGRTVSTDSQKSRDPRGSIGEEDGLGAAGTASPGRSRSSSVSSVGFNAGLEPEVQDLSTGLGDLGAASPSRSPSPLSRQEGARNLGTIAAAAAAKVVQGAEFTFGGSFGWTPSNPVNRALIEEQEGAVRLAKEKVAQVTAAGKAQIAKAEERAAAATKEAQRAAAEQDRLTLSELPPATTSGIQFPTLMTPAEVQGELKVKLPNLKELDRGFLTKGDNPATTDRGALAVIKAFETIYTWLDTHKGDSSVRDSTWIGIYLTLRERLLYTIYLFIQSKLLCTDRAKPKERIIESGTKKQVRLTYNEAKFIQTISPPNRRRIENVIQGVNRMLNPTNEYSFSLFKRVKDIQQHIQTTFNLRLTAIQDLVLATGPCAT